MNKTSRESYRVPSLAEADSDYAALLVKKAELNDLQASLYRERRALEKTVKEDASREVRPAIAELLGDGTGTKATSRLRLAAVRQSVADIEAAFSVLEQRIRDKKVVALRKVVALARPEYNKRLSALCAALKVAAAAHVDLDELFSGLEAEDVDPAHMGARPHFLGDAVNGRIDSFLKEAAHGV